jgi:hypothetical protein
MARLKYGFLPILSNYDFGDQFSWGDANFASYSQDTGESIEVI